jgi:hypothetical protein
LLLVSNQERISRKSGPAISRMPEQERPSAGQRRKGRINRVVFPCGRL